MDFTRILLLLFYCGADGSRNRLVPDLLKEFSQIVDLNSEEEMNVFVQIKEEFVQLLRESKDILYESLICDVIWSFTVFISNARKIFLSSGRGETIKTVGTSWPGSEALLELLLLNFTDYVSESVGKPVCKEGLTPLEFSVKLHNINAVMLLLELDQLTCQSSDCELVLHYAAVKQDTNLIMNLINNLIHDDINVICGPYSTAYFICGLGLACQSYDAFTNILYAKEHDCTLDHPPSIIDRLLSQPGFNNEDFQALYYSTVAPSGAGGWYASNDLVESTCDIPIIMLEDITTQDFKILDYFSVPVLIKGGLKDSPLFEEWSVSSLRENYGHIEVTGGTIPYGDIFGELSGVSTISEFLDYMADYNNKANRTKQLPLYIFDGYIIPVHFLSQVIIPDELLIWNATLLYQFILGPKGSGAPFHYHCNAINGLVYGRKQWFLYPPGEGYYSKTHPLNWNHDGKHLQCLQFAGDILYVPSGWSHSTLNIDDCIGYAVEFDTSDC